MVIQDTTHISMLSKESNTYDEIDHDASQLPKASVMHRSQDCFFERVRQYKLHMRQRYFSLRLQLFNISLQNRFAEKGKDFKVVRERGKKKCHDNWGDLPGQKLIVLLLLLYMLELVFR